MSFKRKLAVYVILLFALLLGSFYLIFKSSTLSSVQYFEEQETLKEVDSSVRHINMEVSHLVAFTNDWGDWDETYDFVQGKNSAKYIKVNLEPESMAKQSNDFIAFANRNGQFVHGIMIDHAAVKNHPVSEELKNFVADLTVDKKMSGVVVLDGKAYIVASKSVLTSMHKGPPQGVILVGREIRPEMIHLDNLNHKISFSMATTGYGYFDGAYRSFIENIDGKTIEASGVVKDVHNKPVFKITVSIEREMYEYAKERLFYVFIFLFILSAIFSIGIIFLMQKVVSLQQRIFHTSRLASLGTLGAGIAHELNNHLAVVYGYAQNLERLIEEKKIKDPNCTGAVAKILAYTNRMKNIVEKISVFSRTDDNLRTTKVEDINYIINDSLLLLRKELELRNISLVLKLDGKLPKVIVNSIKMETALHNIIMNAKEELEEFPQKKDKKITISTEADKQNSFIVIKIADNGKGISGDNIMRVFDPFFTTKSFGTGATGLGLSIVHGIMNEVGGRVDIDTKEKSGTTLILRIPAVFEESE